MASASSSSAQAVTDKCRASYDAGRTCIVTEPGAVCIYCSTENTKGICNAAGRVGAYEHPLLHVIYIGLHRRSYAECSGLPRPIFPDTYRMLLPFGGDKERALKELREQKWVGPNDVTGPQAAAWEGWKENFSDNPKRCNDLPEYVFDSKSAAGTRFHDSKRARIIAAAPSPNATDKTTVKPTRMSAATGSKKKNAAVQALEDAFLSYKGPKPDPSSTSAAAPQPQPGPFTSGTGAAQRRPRNPLLPPRRGVSAVTPSLYNDQHITAGRNSTGASAASPKAHPPPSLRLPIHASQQSSSSSSHPISDVSAASSSTGPPSAQQMRDVGHRLYVSTDLVFDLEQRTRDLEQLEEYAAILKDFIGLEDAATTSMPAQDDEPTPQQMVPIAKRLFLREGGYAIVDEEGEDELRSDVSMLLRDLPRQRAIVEFAKKRAARIRKGKGKEVTQTSSNSGKHDGAATGEAIETEE